MRSATTEQVEGPKTTEILIKRQEIMLEARKYLLKAAEETIFYVASGKCFKRELAKKFNMTEGELDGLIARAAVELVDTIRKL